jgi:hypothetical protein
MKALRRDMKATILVDWDSLPIILNEFGGTTAFSLVFVGLRFDLII